jgi:hypothetical protein
VFKDFCFDLYPNPAQEGSDVTVFMEVKGGYSGNKVYLNHDGEVDLEKNCELKKGKCDIKLTEVSLEDAGIYWAFVDSYKEPRGEHNPGEPHYEPKSGDVTLEIYKEECKMGGEECSSSFECYIDVPYCWGSPFTCHEDCAVNGEDAADDKACCSGYLNPETGKCDIQPEVEKTFILLFIQLEDQMIDFEEKTSSAITHWIERTYLKECTEKIETVAVTDSVCDVPDQSGICTGEVQGYETYQAILDCLKEWSGIETYRNK